ncbi:Synerg-CTERM sorting domain-containing protein [Cloacibacillus porcorum]|mgnify:CR=1 FL=1|uniref:Synerg-CTERM sorting domain-containing protein n=1 Tax=Cloacibacillus porcorum TaxID=1197717 RepID=UPI00145979A1|nr:Synerg-CTERM sorting domain-containing protein [Cloacibacillus porcorum]MCC8183788.1 SYNERG-CTERM sorting domain-containing protein [Cloacibacillus porcorum]MDY5389798.1 Synerg-CTERM sorting domain-containing protein [Cloacibacillus porcorum]NMF17521.1 SYNERG-CTERM sorting domain-containing protein [Cloacibacillus porcorum]
MLKKINALLLTLLLSVTASSALGAPSEITVTDCDPAGLSAKFKVEILSYLPGQENPHMAKGDPLSWNNGENVDNLSNPAALAKLPDKEIFTELLSADSAPVEVRVYLRITLPLETAFTWPDDYYPEDYPHKWKEQIALTYYTNELRGTMTFTPRALAGIASQDQLRELRNVEQLVVVGADGKVQTLKAQAWYGNVGEVQYYNISNGEYGNVWDTQSTFPMTVYGVSYKYLEHDITVTQPENGAIAPIEESGIVKVKHGEDAEFTVTANSGYQIACLLIDGERVDVDERYLCTYKFPKVTGAHTIGAVFEEDANAPEIGADKGVSGTVADVIETSDDTEVAAFEKGGFTNGGTVHIVSASGLVTTKTEGTFTADTDGFVQAVKLKVEYEEGAESRGLTLAVKPLDAAKPFSADKKYYALLLNKKTNYYDLFPTALNAIGNLEVAVKPVGDYFSEGTIFVYSGTATDSGTPVTPDTPANPDSGPKSGGGCAAGVGALALLAALPLLRRRTGK